MESVLSLDPHLSSLWRADVSSFVSFKRLLSFSTVSGFSQMGASYPSSRLPPFDLVLSGRCSVGRVALSESSKLHSVLDINGLALVHAAPPVRWSRHFPA